MTADDDLLIKIQGPQQQWHETSFFQDILSYAQVKSLNGMYASMFINIIMKHWCRNENVKYNFKWYAQTLSDQFLRWHSMF